MYYKNELYSDKGQFCKVDSKSEIYIMFENDGSIHSQSFPPTRSHEYLEPPWYPISEAQYETAVAEFANWLFFEWQKVSESKDYFYNNYIHK